MRGAKITVPILLLATQRMRILLISALTVTTNHANIAVNWMKVYAV